MFNQKINIRNVTEAEGLYHHHSDVSELQGLLSF